MSKKLLKKNDSLVKIAPTPNQGKRISEFPLASSTDVPMYTYTENATNEGRMLELNSYITSRVPTVFPPNINALYGVIAGRMLPEVVYPGTIWRDITSEVPDVVGNDTVWVRIG